MKTILVGPEEHFGMSTVIDSTRLKLRVGTTPSTGSKVVRIYGSSYLSLGNREERKAVRRLATKLLELCDAHEQPICRDPAHCQDCGKVFPAGWPLTHECRA